MNKLFIIFLIAVANYAASPVPFNPNIRTVVASGGGNTVTIDNIGAAATGTGIQLLNTATVTTSANPNRAIFVFIGIGDSNPSELPVSSVTTSGTSSSTTQVATKDAFNWAAVRVYCILNPQASTTHTITVDLSSGAPNADTLFVRAVSFYNVDQTTPFDSIVTSDMGGAATTAPSVSVTVTTGGMGVSFVTSDSENNLTATTGTALFTQTTVASDTSSAANYTASTGSQALSHSTASQPAAIAGFNIRAQ
jgi:hypothetical protein